MPHKDTDSTLSAQQLQAMEALLIGKTVTDSADAARVNRTTIYRWLRQDFHFRAELSRQRRELHDAITRSLLAVALRAVETVASAVGARARRLG